MALELPTGESTRELIKCVMIGDGGVGKTRLICAQALGQGIMPEKRQSLLQCSHGSHKPSVFAIDKYYKSSEIQRRSNMTVDGVRAALRMWDTFGDRQKDRRFAYQNANVIALCFSVNCPQSLESVNDYWYKEIKQSCPRVPIVLVGTKSDCRLEQPLEETKPNKRSSFSQQIKECSIVSPGMGRQVAKEIGAMYYECSVMLMIGLEDVFINVIRAALCGQRAKRLLSKQLRKVLPPQIQVPYKPPRPKTPQVEVPPSTYHTDLVSLFNNKLYHDVEFAIQGMLIKAHKAVLVAASTNFSSLFAIKLSEESKESLNKICPENISVVWPSKSIAVRNNEEGKAVTVIDMDNNINFQAFYSLLKLLYSGSTSAVENIPDLMDAAKLMKVKLLESFLSRVDSDASLFSLWKEAMVFNMQQTLFKKELFSDVCFELDDAIIPAHKAILVSRCEMMAAMFEEGHFKEADRQIVKLTDMNADCFMAVLEYLYTDEVSRDYQGNKVAVMALANFFCLPRLVALYERLIIEEIKLDRSNVRNVVEHLLVAEMHNATHLKSWGEHYITVNYEEIIEHNRTALQLLPVKTARALEAHRWPPVWYLMENEWYKRTVGENEVVRKLQQRRRWYQSRN